VDVFSEIKQYGIAAIAKQNGYLVENSTFSPCPACGAKTRHTKRKDPRLSCLIVQGGSGWLCLQCQAKGDSVDLLARILNQGIRPTTPDAWRAVLSRWTAGGATRTPPTPSASFLGHPGTLQRPPFRDLMSLWDRCSPNAPESTYKWLLSKYPAYLVEEVEETGCVRWMAKDSLPEWWPWKYPMMTMLAFDYHGLVQSLHGRICGDVKEGTPKSRFPKGYSASGLVLANKSAVSWLRGKMEVPAVVIAEGLTSTLACTMALRKTGKWRWGVLGYTSGSSSAIKQMPWTNQDVYVFTDSDKTGEDYCQRIVEALPTNIQPKRVKL
jgi:hypothetical protein